VSRNFATLGPSELRPPFTGPSILSYKCTLFVPVEAFDTVSSSSRLMFIISSKYYFFSNAFLRSMDLHGSCS